jgi:putative transposase
LQSVFAPRFRTALINPEWEDDLYKYITGILQKNKHKMLCINGVEDHLHMLIGFHTTQSISDLIQDAKAGSSQWINDQKLTKTKFTLQGGYGVFSYSKSLLPAVIRYIMNQKAHHKKRKFLNEYRDMFLKAELDFEEHYIFKEPMRILDYTNAEC